MPKLFFLFSDYLHTFVCVGVKPYACSVCDMRFFQRHHLARHSLTHTGMVSPSFSSTVPKYPNFLVVCDLEVPHCSYIEEVNQSFCLNH